MKAHELVPDRVYVLRGLVRNGGHNSRQPMPPALGLLVRPVTARLFMVRLRMGGVRKWAPKPRFVMLASFEREATQREIAMGWPCDYNRKPEAA